MAWSISIITKEMIKYFEYPFMDSWGTFGVLNIYKYTKLY
jgi:hypothetical protein